MRNFLGTHITGDDESVTVAVWQTGGRMECRYISHTDRVLLRLGPVDVPLPLEQAQYLYELLGAGISDAISAKRVEVLGPAAAWDTTYGTNHPASDTDSDGGRS